MAPRRTDWRDRVARARELKKAGVSERDAAKQIGVNPSTLRVWVARDAAEPPASPPAPAGTVDPPAAVPLVERLAAFARDLAAEGLHAHAALVLEAVALAQAQVVDDAPDDAGDVDTLTRMRRMLARAEHDIAKADRSGNYGAVQKLIRDAVALSTTIARTERVQQSSDGAFAISAADIAEAEAKTRAQIDALLAQPLTCGKCGEQLRAAWAHGEDDGSSRGA